MSNRGKEIIDDDGNVMSPPEAGTNAAHALYLLEYARKRGFRIGPVLKVGDVVLQVRDIRQEAAMSEEQRSAAPDVEPGSDMAILLGGAGDE